VIGSAGTAPTSLILDFAAAGISLWAENEVKLAVCILVPPQMARMGHVVEITTGREVAMIGIGDGRQGRACFQGMDIRKAQVSEGDKSAMWIRTGQSRT
jgi:hypothetical protein